MKLSLLSLLLVLIAGTFICVNYYSYVFARTVVGKVVDVQNVLQATTIIQGMQSGKLPGQVFSFAIGIMDDKGEMSPQAAKTGSGPSSKKDNVLKRSFFLTHHGRCRSPELTLVLVS